MTEPPVVAPTTRRAPLALAALAAVAGVALVAGLRMGSRQRASSDPAAAVARVDGAVVTSRQVDVELAMQKVMRVQQGQMLTADAEDLAAFRRDILDQLVDQRLMENDAVTRGVTLTSEQALAEMPQWAPGVDVGRLRADAAAEGLTDAEYADWARRQVVIARYLRLPEVQELGLAEVRSRGGLPRPASAADVAAALERDAQVYFRFDAFGDGSEPLELAMAREGEPAPDFLLHDLAGEPVRLSDLRGQAVVLNFWATWCGPCKVEMPLFEHVYTRNKDHGLVVLAVNVQEEQEAVTRFVADFGMTFPVVLDGRGQVSTLYRVRALPTSIFISPDGRVELAHRGSIVQRAQLLEMVRRILPAAGT